MSEQQAITYQAESELPVAPSASQIAHLRALDPAGNPLLATANQMKELSGIDYSLLTEQIIPGVYLFDVVGVKKQAYTQTVDMSGAITSANTFGFIPIRNLSNVISVEGSFTIQGVSYFVIGSPILESDGAIAYNLGFEHGGELITYRLTSKTLGTTYRFVAKITYTK